MELQEPFQETGFQRCRRMFPWLHLLRVPGIAGRLSLVLAGFCTVVVLLLIDNWLLSAREIVLPLPQWTEGISSLWLASVLPYQLGLSEYFMRLSEGWEARVAAILGLKLLVSAAGGLVMARMAAGLFTREQRISLRGAGKFTVRRLPSFLMGLLFPLLLIACLSGIAGGLLWLGSFSVGGEELFEFQRPSSWLRQLWEGLRNSETFFMGLFYGPALLLMLIANLFLAGVLIGWPLLIAALATENSDGFDAWSRSFDYLRARLLPLILGFLFAMFLGGLVVLVLTVLRHETLEAMDRWQVWVGAFDETHISLQGDRVRVPAAFAVRQFWGSVLTIAIHGYILSLFWTSITALYVLTRHSVDRISLSEFKA